MLKHYHQKDLLVAGLDEAGRGCFAGPVCAAAVILPKNYKSKVLNDSKQLNEKQRDALRIEIEEKALAWAVAMVDNNEIDEINILNASILAMHRALDKLQQKPQYLLVDGNRFKDYTTIPHECVVKGDGKYYAIAAASVLAKTHRDEYMLEIGLEYPQYNWASNKGYPTRDHKDAINLHGITSYHRKSFNMNEQLKLGL
ncbi:MAG: ribonuclease HII [Bacteroidetes bacterium]|nr:MAG: ribonuclease HII [Bacteroidota bacterium]RLD82279.1 MAG: ribonuclease HII [Bacteroidota bacterium]